VCMLYVLYVLQVIGMGRWRGAAVDGRKLACWLGAGC
jgi:hypothetical protein